MKTSEEMKQEMELQLHEQYAQNNNSYFSSIVVLITSLLAVLGVYGYVFVRTSDMFAETWSELYCSSTETYSLDALIYTALVATFVLVLCFHICAYQGTAQRKEQFIIDYIRRVNYSKKDFETDFAPFPKKYSPYGKKWNQFIQGLYWEVIKYIIIAEFVLCLSLIMHIWDRITFVCPASMMDLLRCFALIGVIVLIVFAIYVYFDQKDKYHKIEEYYKITYKTNHNF